MQSGDGEIKRVRVRSRCAWFGFIALYGVLVLASKGDFWPFSVFPMYSNPSRPWELPVLMKLPEDATSSTWAIRTLEELPEEAQSLTAVRIDRREIREAFATPSPWTEERIQALRPLLSGVPADERFLVVSIKGERPAESSTQIRCLPLASLFGGEMTVNPDLRRN